MKRKSSFSRILALVLTLALVLGALTISASAADVTYNMTKTTRTLKTEIGTTLSTVSVSSNDLTTTGVSDANWTGTNAATVLIDLVPAATAASGTLTVDITPSGVTTPTSTDVTVTNGEGIAVKTISGTEYTFVVQSTEEAYPTANYGGNYIGAVAGEGVTLTHTGDASTQGSSSNPYTFTAEAQASGYPFTMSLRFVTRADSFNDVTSYSYTVLDGSDADLQNFVGTYFLAKFPANNTALKFKVTDGSNTKYYQITLSATAGVGGTGLISYLPAPGQFTNEGCNSGGWGDAFISGSTGLKSMVNALSTTGVSLGYFGGYVVLDMGENISNNPNNLYGIDLIAYGNAFINNAEPGCIQVAQADGNAPGDPNKDGVIWYDIANSLYYDSDTATDATFTYTIPSTHKSYNSETDWPYAGAVTSPNSSNNVSYNCSPYDALGATGGDVTYNTFHRHEWFPLWANYFVARTTGTGDDEKTIEPLNGARVTDNTVADPETTAGYPFAAYTRDTTNGSTITLKGVMIKDATATTTSLYRFGFVDAHNNNNSTTMSSHPEYYKNPYNPYAFTSDNIASNNTWASYLTIASNDSVAGGGDPIDISWAVYPARCDNTTSRVVDGITESYTAGDAHPKAGQPAGLGNIRYIRIYTGAAKMNGIFGEISTEVCGVYKAVSGTGSGAAQNTPTVTLSCGTYSETYTLSNLGTALDNALKFNALLNGQTQFTVTVTDTAADYIYVNGVATTSGSAVPISLVSGSQMVQVICQTGTRSPFISTVKLT